MHPSTWLKRFVRWLQQMLGVDSGRQPIRILEQYHNGGNASVLRLKDPTIPGAVDLWRIDRYHERIKFFVCVINVAKLREDLAGLGNRRASSGTRRGMADSLWQQIAAQSDILATHFWIVGWDREVSGIDAQGRHYRSHRVADLALFAVDLQGAAASFAGDRYAVRYARKIITRLAANEFRELAHHRSWQAAVKAIDWIGWLEGLSRSYTSGISSDHVLQPRTTRKPKGMP